MALAPSTITAYRSGIASFTTFCRQTSLPPFPSSEIVLQFYVTSLARTVSYQTIKVYLASIQYYNIVLGHHISITAMDRLFYLLRGIHRSLGDSRTRIPRQPITLPQLRRLVHFIQYNTYNPHDSAMLTSVVTLAFFGLLRVSKYTSPTRASYDPAHTLLYSDIFLTSPLRVAAIRIKASKTDPFKSGCIVRVGVIQDDVCPVTALHRYHSSHLSCQGPLYVFSSSVFLTRNHITSLLRTCFPNAPTINSHSFRIGGASAAASAGVANSTIQILGRWTSDAYRRYICISDDLACDLTRRVASVNSCTRQWDSDNSRSV